MREKYTRFSLADDAEFGQCVMTRSVLSECETKQLEKTVHCDYVTLCRAAFFYLNAVQSDGYISFGCVI